MELAPRKQKILKAIVDSFIATGEPVGSKTLLSETGIEVSPATVRNDMADLASSGYIYQPHTSAGRIPSQKGFRYYIDRLMTPVLPTERARAYIEARLSSCADTPENLLREAAKLLSEYKGDMPVCFFCADTKKKIMSPSKYWIQPDDNIIKKLCSVCTVFS